VGGRVGGRERQSATMFSLPGRCTKLVVNSDRKDKWRCWREEKGVLFFEIYGIRKRPLQLVYGGRVHKFVANLTSGITERIKISLFHLLFFNVCLICFALESCIAGSVWENLKIFVEITGSG
jgi:hypothetical protein